ncbi:MAG TPA: hypothetical protein VFC42_06170 [Methylomirabilota bacterium]|jgi:hypothetical protein|nr:hypothetical protein [Methylomirabilota bacterium]
MRRPSRSLFVAGLLLALAAAGLSGCIVVPAGPPRTAYVAPAPVWVPGHWVWGGYGWVWRQGHWR